MTARIGLLVLLLGAGALRAAYGATAFTITGVTPAVLDPAAGDVTVVTYVVPARANARLSFANAAGQEVTGVTLTYVAAATYTYTWTGKDTSNTPFAYGAYTVTLSGRTILGTTFGSATAGVTLQQTSLPPHAAGELGQTLGTFGTGNFELTKYGTVQFGIAFVAPYSDTLQGITLQWKSRPSPNYGAGTNGVYTFELQSDGVLHYPSGTVIARTTSIRPSDQLGTAGHCALHVPLTADLLVGEHYHLVLYNTDPNPAANWSSPNGAIVQVTPWTGGGCSGEQFNSPWGLTGQWCPYAIYPDSPGSTSLRDNGSHFPVMFTWARHGNSGDPYYGGLVPGTASNAMTLYGRNKYGQVMVWTQPSAAITRIGLLLLKKGSPTGNVLYHLEKRSKDANSSQSKHGLRAG